MKKITLLLLACVGLSLVAQKTPYVPPKLYWKDSAAGERSELVFYGSVIQNTSFLVGKYTYIKHKIRIYRKYKDKLNINDTCVNVVNYYSKGGDAHSFVWNPEVGTNAIFFVSTIKFDKDVKGQLGFADDHGQHVAVRHPGGSYNFGINEFKDEHQVMRFLAQMKSLNIPDSLTNHEVYIKRLKADSIARRQMLRKQFAEERLKVQREKALKDSSEAKRLIGTTIA
jgi:hypothetical protein